MTTLDLLVFGPMNRPSNISRNAGTHESVPDPRNADILIYVDGDFYPRAEAKVSVYDSGFMVGDGIWEGIRYHEGTFLLLAEHLDRLFDTADQVGLDIGTDRAGITEILQSVMDINKMTTDVHVRLMITRGTKKSPSQHPGLVVGGPTIVVIAEYKRPDPDIKAAGVTLFTSQVRRPSQDSLNQNWNCHSKLHEVVALLEAIKHGADEALMLDHNGYVATCNSVNFFMVRDGEVWTSVGESCLNGITRGALIALSHQQGLSVHEADFTVADVLAADEAFVTGTFGGLTPVRSLDGHEIGPVFPGPISRLLTEAYAQLVEQIG